MKPLDLSWGNPKYVEPYWKDLDISWTQSRLECPMPYIYGGTEELKNSILKLHEKELNIFTADKHISIGNGATQLLIATMACLGESVTAQAPYFLRFPRFAQMSGNPFQLCGSSVEVITIPNNPDGDCYKFPKHKLTSPKIYDLSYNWLPYLPKGTTFRFNEDIMIFSLAKATGHASTRIGWALFKDETLAKKVDDYIEHASAGVSIEAQNKAIAVINSQLHTEDTCFKYGQKVLLERWERLRNLSPPFEILNKNGMFLWCQAKNWQEILEQKQVIGTAGELFGGTKEQFRLNIGCSSKEFEELLKRL
mgnify:CR=1 FL=1